MAQIVKTSIILLLLIAPMEASGQQDILGKRITFKKEVTSTGEALNIISRITGFYFTYDTKLIDSKKKSAPLVGTFDIKTILDTIFHSEEIHYSVVQNHIILYKKRVPVEPAPGTTGETKTNSVSGIITDFVSGEGLPYATVGLVRKGTGTVSNYNGEFILKLPPENINDTLSISSLGYTNRLIPVKEISGNNLTIKMFRDYIPIPEIIIRIQDPQEIIRKARDNIKDNFGQTPAILDGFYREGVHRKSDLQMVSEAVVSIYKSPYTNTLQTDQLKVVKSRKIENSDPGDTLVLRLKGGLGSCLELDGVKQLFDFISPENMQFYTLRLSDIVTIDDQSAFVIDFVQNEGLDYPLYEGSVYINTDNYAILLAEFQLLPSLIHKSSESFVSGQTRGFLVRPRTARYRISYRNINGRYFLNHVRGDIDFTARQKKKIFSSQYSVFFEMAVTSTDTTDIYRFAKSETTQLQAVFSKSVTSYDSEFWGDLNFIKPEEDLQEALKTITDKLKIK